MRGGKKKTKPIYTFFGGEKRNLESLEVGGGRSIVAGNHLLPCVGRLEIVGGWKMGGFAVSSTNYRSENDSMAERQMAEVMRRSHQAPKHCTGEQW